MQRRLVQPWCCGLVLGRCVVGEICGSAHPNTHTGADFFYARAACSADTCVAEPRNETGTQRVGLCGSARSRRAASPSTGSGVGWARKVGRAVSWGLASAAAPALDCAATPIGGRNCGWWRGRALQQRRCASIGPRPHLCCNSLQTRPRASEPLEGVQLCCRL